MTVYGYFSILGNPSSDKSLSLYSRSSKNLSAKGSSSSSLCSCAPTSHPGSFRCRLHRVQQNYSRKKIPLPISVGTVKTAVIGKSRFSNVNFSPSSMFDGMDSSSDKEKNPFRFLQLASAAGLAGVAIKAGIDWAKKHGKTSQSLSIAEIEDMPSGATHAGIGKGSHVYFVQRGDTLFHIAEKFGSTVEILKEANGLKQDLITPGEKLWVPHTYTIQKGDTLFKIAQKHGTSIHDILKINYISDPNLIFPGDILLLP